MQQEKGGKCDTHKIVVITSDSAFGDRLVNNLASVGYEAKMANNGNDGLALIIDTLPHLILLDIILPGIDGYELLEKKLAEPMLATIPVFLMSTQGTPINMRKVPHGSVKEFIVALHADVADIAKKVNGFFMCTPAEIKTDTVLNGKKILWVEDDRLIGNILGKKLIASGFDLVHVKNGEEAMKQLDTIMPDALLVDLLLPGMSGFDILQKVKSNPNLRGIPTMILSNLSKPSDVEKAKMLGAQKFLVKAAVSLDQIVAEVHGLTKS